MTYFTSDTHFGHANIIKYCDRPFTSVEEMNEELVHRWNARVGPTDTVWHLGDFALGKRGVIEEYARRLNGEKYLILGNHDRRPKREYLDAGFKLLFNGYVFLTDEEVYLCHYPPGGKYKRHWGGRPWLHGHVHNVPSVGNNIHNISVERTNYAPVTMEEALKL